MDQSRTEVRSVAGRAAVRAARLFDMAEEGCGVGTKETVPTDRPAEQGSPHQGDLSPAGGAAHVELRRQPVG